MHEPTRRSPLIPLARVATLVAIGDLVTKQIAVLWIGTLEPRASSLIRFGVVHNDKGAFGLTVGNYTWELSLALTLAAIALIIPVAKDLARIDDRAPTALGLIAGGAIGNLVSLLERRAESTRRYIHSWIIRALFRHPMEVQRTAEEYLAMVRKAGFVVPESSISSQSREPMASGSCSTRRM